MWFQSIILHRSQINEDILTTIICLNRCMTNKHFPKAFSMYQIKNTYIIIWRTQPTIKSIGYHAETVLLYKLNLCTAYVEPPNHTRPLTVLFRQCLKESGEHPSWHGKTDKSSVLDVVILHQRLEGVDRLKDEFVEWRIDQRRIGLSWWRVLVGTGLSVETVYVLLGLCFGTDCIVIIIGWCYESLQFLDLFVGSLIEVGGH